MANRRHVQPDGNLNSDFQLGDSQSSEDQHSSNVEAEQRFRGRQNLRVKKSATSSDTGAADLLTLNLTSRLCKKNFTKYVSGLRLSSQPASLGMQLQVHLRPEASSQALERVRHLD